MPVLQVDDIKLVQSTTIARFLAKQFHLAGRDNLEEAKVEAFADTINDLLSKIISIRGQQNQSKKQEFMRNFAEIIARLYSDGDHYFVGNDLTWEDLFFYDLGETILQSDQNCLNNHTWLKQNRHELEKQTKIDEYIKNRAKTPF